MHAKKHNSACQSGWSASPLNTRLFLTAAKKRDGGASEKTVKVQAESILSTDLQACGTYAYTTVLLWICLLHSVTSKMMQQGREWRTCTLSCSMKVFRYHAGPYTKSSKKFSQVEHGCCMKEEKGWRYNKLLKVTEKGTIFPRVQFLNSWGHTTWPRLSVSNVSGLCPWESPPKTQSLSSALLLTRYLQRHNSIHHVYYIYSRKTRVHIMQGYLTIARPRDQCFEV